MTAHTIANRRLLAGCIAALAVLTFFLGVYARSERQVLALRGELARVQPGALYGDGARKSPNSDAGDTQTARLGVGL